jgi:uncharacterized membrane protein YdjX (TVP38/TMEM64 family)
VIVLAMVAVFATGVHRTFRSRRWCAIAWRSMLHRAHGVAAIAAYMAIYIVVVALSIPGSLLLTITGGVLFGIVIGGIATVISATIGATIVFLVAKSACGENLMRRAGPLACKLVDGFKADAFNYLLFLRLVPAFPFFLVNLVPALVGVRLSDLRRRHLHRHHSGGVRIHLSRIRARQRDCRARRHLPRVPCSRPHRL